VQGETNCPRYTENPKISLERGAANEHTLCCRGVGYVWQRLPSGRMQGQHRITEYHHSPQPSSSKEELVLTAVLRLDRWFPGRAGACTPPTPSRLHASGVYHIYFQGCLKGLESEHSKATGRPYTCQGHNLKVSSPSTVRMSAALPKNAFDALRSPRPLPRQATAILSMFWANWETMLVSRRGTKLTEGLGC
jgi:hypothetical protein